MGKRSLERKEKKKRIHTHQLLYKGEETSINDIPARNKRLSSDLQKRIEDDENVTRQTEPVFILYLIFSIENDDIEKR